MNLYYGCIQASRYRVDGVELQTAPRLSYTNSMATPVAVAMEAVAKKFPISDGYSYVPILSEVTSEELADFFVAMSHDVMLDEEQIQQVIGNLNRERG